MYAFLDGVHEKLMETLAEVDRLCRENGIVYSISGGTVLGAVRHKGHFIPWDDDCDVEMRAKDYFCFMHACKKQLDKSRFFLQNKATEPDYMYVFSKLRRNGTTDLPLDHEPLQDIHWGLAVDIFPTFGRPKWRWADGLSNFITGLAGALAWAPMEAGGWAKMLHRVKLAAPCCRLCMRVLRFIEWALPTDGSYTIKFKFGYHKSFTTATLLPVRDMPFEGLMVMGPANPVAYLDERNDKYVNWREPAPPQAGVQYHAKHCLDAQRNYTDVMGEKRT